MNVSLNNSFNDLNFISLNTNKEEDKVISDSIETSETFQLLMHLLFLAPL